MVSSKQKHDLKFEQNPSLLNGHKKFILYSCRVSQSEEGKEKKILIYYESERQMLNTNNTKGVS